ncbi:hypothetical protein E9677_10525 [Rhizobium rhizophilum]|uniref:Uncharacterized protein n=1 Tax=Rhizobium rhizophilum TaxID=1850373 RepID=A0ABY2QXE6_9HYPH|nr:hypothetical protein [Rhizobium rhizophilum]THV15766.1 hypothetical protein E9677_10525 [Rhizobium rhizophilum]
MIEAVPDRLDVSPRQLRRFRSDEFKATAVGQARQIVISARRTGKRQAFSRPQNTKRIFFLDSPRMVETLKRLDFHLADPKHGDPPLPRPAAGAPIDHSWRLRRLVTQSLTEMARDQPPGKQPL